ncbi:RHS repeat-associated core domain-containing protein, partial [Vitiosangium sp. GDMCC 1.1324]|uniref:RHS repeat-associated core domain-containing protein n=1 Tax=Vitiosangium sp. (strain GDMCC 1.1324) TaxID=2138576 RepID=UPI000D3FA81D
FYDADGGAPPSGCSAPTFTQGRLRMARDSGGDTWYSYDNQGRLVSELRVRPGATSCSETHSDSNPHLRYSYTDNGNLASIIYPHGRRVEYVYSSDLKRVDRIDSISVALYTGTPASWTQTTLVSNISWEPFGGVRGYHLRFPTSGTTASLEYLLGDNAGTAPSSSCPSTMPSQSSSDWTGRLRALWLSSGAQPLGSGSGDLFKRTYTWQADQVSQINTCVRSASSQVEQFGYDRLLRLTSATMPSVTSTGGSYRIKSPAYDSRGNRTRLSVDEFGNGFTYAYSGDRLQSYVASRAGTMLARNYSYNRDGRIEQIQWPNDSSGLPGRSLRFNYNTDTQSAGNMTVFRAVEVVGGAFYNYWYDAQGRRRLKVHPTDQTEEYFYDQDRHLLEDRGFASLSQNAPYPLDEYIWLGERPIAMLRSSFDASWNRQPDSEGSCQRLGGNERCGVYFIVSDHLGKPVLMLDGSGRITGTGEYSPFGELNRVDYWGETQHPYASNTPSTEIGRVSQPSLGLSMDVRLRFDSLDTEACGGYYYDPTYVVDGNTNAQLAGPFGGHHLGPYVSSWLNYPSASSLVVKFQSDSGNWAPNAFGCVEDTGVNFPYSGVALRAYEYRRYDGALGAAPMWTPLRFPGQYHDPETDLFENWNRYYDSSTGRYLQPEPVIATRPGLVKTEATRGMVTPLYAYANNNPQAYTDPTGLFSTDEGCKNYPTAADILNKTSMIDDRCLKECIIDQVVNAHLKCDYWRIKDYCRRKPNVAGASPLGSCKEPEEDITWCSRDIDSECQILALMHEFAHSCGWDHNQGKGVPGNSGELECGSLTD